MPTAVVIVFLSVVLTPVWAQSVEPSAHRIIDMHMHTPLPEPPYGQDSARAFARRTLAQIESLHVVLAVMSGPEDELDVYGQLGSNRLILAPMFPCDGGLDFAPGRPADVRGKLGHCLRSRSEFPDTAWLRRQFRSGRFRAMGELVNQYAGVPFDDPRMMPYYAMAQDLDVPVAFHTGGSFPLTAQGCCPKFRLALGDPMRLEEVLVRYPRLRIQIMHGWPTDQLFSLLYQYPQLVVDLTPFPAFMPPPAFHALLRKYKDAGFLDRILFGTDSGPDDIPKIVAAYTSADFLTPEDLAGILCGNAERFLRLRDICSGLGGPK